VKDALVTLRNNGFIINQLKNFKFSFKEFWNGNNLLITKANDITFVDSVFIFNVEANLNVFTRFCIVDGFFLSIQNSLDLARYTTWHQSDTISKLYSTGFNFTKDNAASILHFVENGNAQWSICITRRNW
jgi:hypothetical protein